MGKCTNSQRVAQYLLNLLYLVHIFSNILFLRYTLSSTFVQGIETPKEKHEGKRETRDQKTVFASFEFCFFVVRRQWTGLPGPGPIWQRCIRSLCIWVRDGGGGGWAVLQESALCVCRHNQKYFECFLCKVRRFFSLCCLTVTVLFFACRFCSRTLNGGGGRRVHCSNFWGLFQRLLIEFC